MPRLKTESEAQGIPLSRLFFQASPDALRRCFSSLATILITLFSHRFPRIGSLYQHPTHPSPLSTSLTYHYRVGPIVSWPFFGGGRGEFADVPRGPWATEQEYLIACTEREFQAVRREGEGVVHHHRPHLPPDDEPSSEEDDDGILGTPSVGALSPPLSAMSRSGSGVNISMRRPGVSRRHHSHRGAGLSSIVGSTMNSPGPTRPGSPDSESSSSSSEEEFYRDHRAHLRSSLLVANQQRRLENCMNDMQMFLDYMTKTLGVDGDDEEFREFALDLHDLSLTNVFVDPEDLGKITCIIDWESTTIRPLWQCAHLPSFLASDPTSPHAMLFREVVSELGLPQRASGPESAPASTVNVSASNTVNGVAADGSALANGITSPHGPTHSHSTSSVIIAPSPPASSSSSFSSPSTAATSVVSPPSSPTKVSSTPQTSEPTTITKPKHVIPPTTDVHPPEWAPNTPPPEILQREAQRWLKGEKEGDEWRRAHKVVEWDGWEEGLVGMILSRDESGGALGLNNETLHGMLKPTSAISPAAVSHPWAINGHGGGHHHHHHPHGHAHTKRW
ncbi:hypothetical protein FRC02_001877 [Tulasnella sp. 418]|nr:hypothetical protein FRC02_001877 [Tulasnella sp. 418]